MSNSDNPKKGAEFQRQVQAWFQEQLGPGFEYNISKVRVTGCRKDRTEATKKRPVLFAEPP
jgi:hypothetical protein